MTVETEVATLTTAVDNLTSAVNVSKATLDTKVANAVTAKTAAELAETHAETAETNALASKNAAAASASAAAISEANTSAVATGGTGSITPTAGKLPIADSEGNIADGWLSPESKAMSKTEFFALAEKRKRDSAGSGFSEWGKHYLGTDNVNNGLWDIPSSPNMLRMGMESGGGASRTEYPISNVNGVTHALRRINTTNVTRNYITFPPAPDGTKTYDSATGAVVTHASAAEAFEGLVTNGDFRNGDDGSWNLSGSGSGTITVDATGASFNGNNTSASCYLSNSTTYPAGTHRIEINSTSNQPSVWVSLGGVYNQVGLKKGVTTLEITHSGGGLSVNPRTPNTATKILSVSVMPATESVITSRQDFGFIESWHEKISEKDAVFPLGNVQYGASSWEGMSTHNITESWSEAPNIAQGYSAFGEWDTATLGRGRRWSTLSAANKAKFLEDPENNIYSDGDDLIQVRYRVRVVEGLGDSWEYTSPYLAPDSKVLSYSEASSEVRVKPKGSLTSIADDLASYSSAVAGDYMSSSAVAALVEGIDGDVGVWKVRTSNAASYAHNGLCFAIPLFLVQRRNQGAYHPVFNAEGCTTWWDEAKVASSNRIWHGTDTHIATSALECFYKKADGGWAAGTRGNIATGISGRPDSKAFDAIYASDVQDLRMSSKSLPLAEIREKYKRMAIAGEVRGFEAVPFTIAKDVNSPANSQISGGRIINYLNSGDFFKGYATDAWQPVIGGYVVRKSDGLLRAVKEVTYSSSADKSSIKLVGDDAWSYDSFFVGGFNQTHKQAKPTWTDIIGSPANIAATFPNGVEGQWIPVIPVTGTTVTAKLNRKSLETTIARESTGDSGVTWGANPVTLNTTLNEWTAAFGGSSVYIIHYETQAHFTQDESNSKVLDLGSVFGSSDHRMVYGGLLSDSLVGKVSTVSGADTKKYKPVLGFTLDTFKLHTSSTVLPEHSVMNLAGTGAAVKTLDYLSSENNVAKLCYAYKEMKFDSSADAIADAQGVSYGAWTALTKGTIYRFSSNGSITGNDVVYALAATTNSRAFNSGDLSLINGEFANASGWLVLWDGNGFGDNNKFEITNNQSTLTDDNGNTVLYGTASFNTQHFVIEE